MKRTSSVGIIGRRFCASLARGAPERRIRHTRGSNCRMRAPRSLRRVLLAAALAAVYTAAGKLGLTLAVVHPSATAVWPGTAIGIAALVVFGDALWPGILAGAFLVNVTTAGTPATSLGIACGNTLEALAGAYLLRRLCGGRSFFERAPSIFLFALVVAPLATSRR